jgi:hypothetical protein
MIEGKEVPGRQIAFLDGIQDILPARSAGKPIMVRRQHDQG